MMHSLQGWFQKNLDILLITLIAFLTPIKYLLFGVGALIIIDTIIGIWRSLKLNQKITSKRLSNVISKMFLYQIAVISAYIVQLMIGLDEVPLAQVVGVAIALTELKSIHESVEEVTGLNVWSFVRSAFNRSTTAVGQIANDVLEKEEEKK